MKKYIDGKVYDTETAELIAENPNNRFNYNTSDFTYCLQWLYRKRNGTFFLYGEGGAMSQYKQEVGAYSYCCGRDIEVLSNEEAKDLYGEWGNIEEEDEDKTLQEILDKNK
jgi:hypothetical protein